MNRFNIAYHHRENLCLGRDHKLINTLFRQESADDGSVFHFHLGRPVAFGDILRRSDDGISQLLSGQASGDTSQVRSKDSPRNLRNPLMA